jgi:integrase
MSTPVSVAISNSIPKKSGGRRSDNVRKRGTSWQARLVLNGKSETRTFPSKGEALQWLQLKRGEQFDGDLGKFHKAQQLTLRSAILGVRDHLIATQKEAAEQQHLSRLKILAERPGTDIPLLEVLPNEIEAIFADLQANGMRGKPLGDNTMRLYYAALSSVYKHYIFGEKWQFLPNPLAGIKRPKPGPDRSRRLMDDEEDRIVSALSEYGPAYTLVFMLLISTTMRMGELFALTWVQFDEQLSSMDIKVSKTGERVCPLSVEAIELLSRLPRINDKVIPITRNAFEMAWKRAMPRLEIENLRRHDLRREGLTRWAQRGIGIVELMKISGHKTLSQAQKYLVGTTSEAVDAMNSKLSDDPYLQHRQVKEAAPKQSLLRHFHTGPSPTEPAPGAQRSCIDELPSNVFLFPLAKPRAMVAPTRRTKASGQAIVTALKSRPNAAV